MPVTARWEKNGMNYSRTQLPLILAWAITIHKSQGLTLSKAVIDLGPRDFALGLAFVAISRVKSLDGLAFRSDFPISRLLRPTETESMRQLQNDTNCRLQESLVLDEFEMDLSEYVFNEE